MKLVDKNIKLDTARVLMVKSSKYFDDPTKRPTNSCDRLHYLRLGLHWISSVAKLSRAILSIYTMQAREKKKLSAI